jgi:simple sugar transport system substrate-binding protein/ribose transport system substrate-binding protein
MDLRSSRAATAVVLAAAFGTLLTACNRGSTTSPGSSAVGGKPAIGIDLPRATPTSGTPTPSTCAATSAVRR